MVDAEVNVYLQGNPNIIAPAPPPPSPKDGTADAASMPADSTSGGGGLSGGAIAGIVIGCLVVAALAAIGFAKYRRSKQSGRLSFTSFHDGDAPAGDGGGHGVQMSSYRV